MFRRVGAVLQVGNVLILKILRVIENSISSFEKIDLYDYILLSFHF